MEWQIEINKMYPQTELLPAISTQPYFNPFSFNVPLEVSPTFLLVQARFYQCHCTYLIAYLTSEIFPTKQIEQLLHITKYLVECLV